MLLILVGLSKRYIVLLLKSVGMFKVFIFIRLLWIIGLIYGYIKLRLGKVSMLKRYVRLLLGLLVQFWSTYKAVIRIEGPV